jgi:hypothetical protein
MIIKYSRENVPTVFVPVAATFPQEFSCSCIFCGFDVLRRYGIFPFYFYP